MSRAIKVEDQVYQELYLIQAKGETFSQVIEAMLKARITIFTLINAMEDQLKYQEWKQQQIHEVLNR